MEQFQNVNVRFCTINSLVYLLKFNYFLTDANCVSLPNDKNEGLTVLRNNEDSVLVPFRENVTLHCGSNGRTLRHTSSSSFRQCVYDPKSVRLLIYT